MAPQEANSTTGENLVEILLVLSGLSLLDWLRSVIIL